MNRNTRPNPSGQINQEGRPNPSGNYPLPNRPEIEEQYHQSERVSGSVTVSALGGVQMLDVVEVEGITAESNEVIDSVEDSESSIESRVSERVERALDNCEFETTPEIVEAIKGYYEDHMYLEEAITAVAESDFDSPIFSLILESDKYEDWERQFGSSAAFYESENGYRVEAAPNARIYALRLAAYVTGEADNLESNSDVKTRAIKLAGKSMSALYAESSVGVSTLEDRDIDRAAGLADLLIETAGTDSYTGRIPSYTMRLLNSEDMKNQIYGSQGEFWRDIRRAGQLLFHGSSDLASINVHGLMSRNQQLRMIGTMRNSTMLNSGGDTMHSVVPHFTEFYGMGDYTNGEHGGTLAIPIAKVIEQAPYARDAKYGIVKLSPDSEHDICEPTIEKPIGSIGAGHPDAAGGGGGDRVFFSSNNETGEILPDEYSIDMHDKEDKPATYIIYRQYNKIMSRIDNGYSKRDLTELGTGYGFPERLIIEAVKPYEEDHELTKNIEEHRTSAAEQIRNLQKEYFKAYNHLGVVVPLRRGVFAQVFEGMPSRDGKGRKQATIYNRYTPGTGVRV